MRENIRGYIFEEHDNRIYCNGAMIYGDVALIERDINSFNSGDSAQLAIEMYKATIDLLEIKPQSISLNQNIQNLISTLL